MKRGCAMKVELNKRIILEQLSIENHPVGVDGKKLVFEPNPSHTPYIVFDSKLTGFGVKVSSTKKTYIIQKKVTGGRVIKTKVGDVADFDRIEDARDAAAKLSVQIRATNTNPNVERRRLILSEATLGDAMDKYLNHLKTGKRKATENTIKNFERSTRKLAVWNTRRIKSLSSDEITTKFNELAAIARTATEQAFRWASTACEHLLTLEAADAQSQGRQPNLFANPFRILVKLNYYRTRAELENAWSEAGLRNPLGKEQIGEFLETLWARRNYNDGATGVDYLILMLLMGTRKSEHAGLVWRELLAEEGKKPTSPELDPEQVEWADVTNGEVFIPKTKNGRRHRIFLGPMATNLLRLRQREQAEANASAEGRRLVKSRRYVFPVRSTSSKTRTPHYRDSGDLLKRAAADAGIPNISPHDLRRTFGSIAEHSAVIPRATLKRLMNHAGGDVTDRYTEAEKAICREAMARIEAEMLRCAPNVYNDLRPIEWPPIEAKERRPVPQAKPRTGRPRKQQEAED
jgi:integrase